MRGATEPGRYSISLSGLERAVHVPVDQQVTEQAEPPPPAPIPPEEADRLLLLGITGAGRLRSHRSSCRCGTPGQMRPGDAVVR